MSTYSKFGQAAAKPTHPITHIRRSELHRRGWTDALIKELMPVPHVVTTTGFDTILWLWHLPTVAQTEQSAPEFQARLRKIADEREAARAAELQRKERRADGELVRLREKLARQQQGSGGYAATQAAIAEWTAIRINRDQRAALSTVGTAA